MYEENRIKLGFFVLSGIFLLVGFVFFLGLKSALEPKLRFYTMFEESVQGLEVGSPVKFKGVTIGSVASIKILRSSKKIRVDMDVNPNSIDHQPQKDEDGKSVDQLTSQIERGLCCQLQMTGITGMKFIEIDYFKDSQCFKDWGSVEAGFIPPGISVFQNTVVSVNEALTRIAKVDFEGISKDLRKTIQSVNEITNAKDVKEGIKAAKDTLMEINKTVVKFNHSIEEGRIATLLEKVDKTLKSIDMMSVAIEKQVNDADLATISKKVQGSLDKLTGTGEQTLETISATLKTLNTAMVEIRDLVELLEEDPASLLRGKQKKDRFAK